MLSLDIMWMWIQISLGDNLHNGALLFGLSQNAKKLSLER